MDKILPKTKEEAREQAIDWQAWVSEQNLSYGELAEWQYHFTLTGRMFGLIREFKREGIL